MKVLVIGSKGQLGCCLADQLSDTGYEIIFTSRAEIDIADLVSTKVKITALCPTIVINASAYTAVDKAEDDQYEAEKINHIAVANIASTCSEIGCWLIHISTDYVFDGDHFLPYKESDPVSPIGVYGETKRAGELAVINSAIDAIVIRTSWLYSSHGNNFVKTMLRLGSEKENLGVIFDQVGTPTYARDLAKTCLEILTGANSLKISKDGNLYHYSNEGVASWYDFAISIMELGGENCKVKPIQTKDYPTLAKRPQYSVLNKFKIKTDFKIEIPYWRDSLKDCLEKIKS